MLLVILLWAMLASSGSAQTKAPSREEALHSLAAPETQTRRGAVIALAERGEMRDTPALVQALRDPDEIVRGLAEQALWIVWSRSGDAAIDGLFRDGLDAMQAGRLRESVRIYSQIIERKPDFAEGWNKRATAYFLLGELDRSLADCAEVMKRNPHHFGALSGYGQIYVQQGLPEKALEYFRRALEVNPNMPGVRMGIEGLEEALRNKPKRAI